MVRFRNTDRVLRHDSPRGLRFAASLALGLSLLGATLGSPRVARATDCTYVGCFFWNRDHQLLYRSPTRWQQWDGNDWSFGNDACFYGGNEKQGCYSAGSDDGSWFWYETVDGTWYYLYPANFDRTDWFFQPYVDPAAYGNTAASSTSGGAAVETATSGTSVPCVLNSAACNGVITSNWAGRMLSNTINNVTLGRF